MFTVKLYSGKHLKIVQTKMVDVYKERKFDGVIEVVTDDESFFIRDLTKCVNTERNGQPNYWDCAYVENERGATTQRITPKMILA
jgi:hypothetical protein